MIIKACREFAYCYWVIFFNCREFVSLFYRYCSSINSSLGMRVNKYVNRTKIEQNRAEWLNRAILIYIYCWFQVVTIDRERLISEKQNNKASPTGARLPKEAMLLGDIFKFTKPSLHAFRPFGIISRACQGPKGPPNSIDVDYYKTG